MLSPRPFAISVQSFRALDSRHSTDNYLWALKDVSFEVKRGEVLGIIGRNGAGNSHSQIRNSQFGFLSQITEPTEGRAELNGHVGSLLEVGTGFHPELTCLPQLTFTHT